MVSSNSNSENERGMRRQLEAEVSAVARQSGLTRLQAIEQLRAAPTVGSSRRADLLRNMAARLRGANSARRVFDSADLVELLARRLPNRNVARMGAVTVAARNAARRELGRRVSKQPCIVEKYRGPPDIRMSKKARKPPRGLSLVYGRPLHPHHETHHSRQPHTDEPPRFIYGIDSSAAERYPTLRELRRQLVHLRNTGRKRSSISVLRDHVQMAINGILFMCEGEPQRVVGELRQMLRYLDTPTVLTKAVLYGLVELMLQASYWTTYIMMKLVFYF